ncbi:helix-turn-helix transcriptional regulator [Deinococcus sp. VB343]|uniref:Helix-turn-helix transcriptional regulator n=1 Tax=Deinococcus sp. VB142 TaxID=3112952 RepID=A0AAU6Q7M9_9DEIO
MDNPSLPLPALPDDERVLLLLGLLTSQERHGYEINEFIERQLGCVIHLKKATAYQLLERLEQHGLIRSHTEQHGARPTRKVYALTESGQTHFMELLQRQLADEEILVVSGSVPLMFCEHLPQEERVAALRQREGKLARRLGSYAELMGRVPLTRGVRLAMERIQALTQADLDWTRRLLEAD